MSMELNDVYESARKKSKFGELAGGMGDDWIGLYKQHGLDSDDIAFFKATIDISIDGGQCDFDMGPDRGIGEIANILMLDREKSDPNTAPA